MTFDPSDRFSLRDDLVVEKIDDEVVVLDLAGNQYFGLNEVAWLIWQAIDEDDQTLGEIVASMAASFEIDEQQARGDAEAFLEQLVDAELASRRAEDDT